MVSICGVFFLGYSDHDLPMLKENSVYLIRCMSLHSKANSEKIKEILGEQATEELQKPETLDACVKEQVRRIVEKPDRKDGESE